MSAETQMRGIEFAAKFWPKDERDWLRSLSDRAPREVMVLMDIVGEFDAMPVGPPLVPSVPALGLSALQASNRTGGRS